MIDSAGWFDWAIIDPGPRDKLNGGRNTCRGVVPHSAEGYWPFLRTLLRDPNRRASWFASNLRDGRFIQHYSVYDRTWTSGAAYPNNNFNAWENEGMAGEPFTPAQNVNNIRVIRELEALGGWKLRRPVSETDLTATGYEHTECVRWGAMPTACPSGRVPWALYLEEDDMKPYLCWNIDKQAVFWVGPFGAIWITDAQDVPALEKLYGKMEVALHDSTLRQLLAS